ncbi:phthiocerol/phenolphthiocerol synthesis type-I polyketide synthase E [Streptacidiphilus sp. MAP12-20]|uniref:type I polyketide synthase n=1 Tax=Streptacidiphilus sp. MAP12-20 TaxID=3156299 RepID=UPI003511D473
MTRIAVIGLAGRLPGASDLDAYWANLLAGRDCVTRTPADELRGLVPDELLDDPRWIGASGRITGVYDFDPACFGMSPKEALTTDPQHRLLLTSVHRALEDAAVVPGPAAGRIGLFAGVGRNRHEEVVRAVLAARGETPNELALEIGNEKDHSSTKTAYRLGLGGPVLTVQTACSTGLVALHQACQSLAAQECDLAVAAAAAVRAPDQYGYLYLNGGIGSVDGVCRPFSERAGGAVAGDGVVAVVLKRLEDALADGDRVYAVVRGSAVNNDGAKSGYASVSAPAQRQVLREALLFAETEPETVGSVETHGSGTPLGDATEWAALRDVYGKGQRTLVGSVKSGIGHLREASGLAGLVRAVFSVRHGLVPPTINVGLPAGFTTRDDSGLTLSRSAQPWPLNGPRRAAVSAFGLGGTNAHVILEQPPEPRPRADLTGPGLVLLSAHTAPAATRTAQAWTETLADEAIPAAVAAEVSQSGRRARRHRTFVLAGTATDGLPAPGLEPAPEPVAAEPGGPGLCFVFPGTGDHYPGMGAGLAAALPGYAEHLDRYLAACSEQTGRELRGVLAPGPARAPGGGQVFDLRRLVTPTTGRGHEVFDPVASHAVLFSLQLALARALEELGLRPDAVTGHSLGELVSATLAGIFTEQDAIRVVVRRAQLVAEQPEGAMLAVSLPRADAEQLTGPGVWLAAANSPRSSVLAGDREALLRTVDELHRRGLQGRLLPVRHAFHTPLLDEAGAQLQKLLTEMELSQPRIPLVANSTGAWAGPEIAEPAYWRRQLTSPVLFGQALATAAERCGVLIEIGPGQLRTLAGQDRSALGDSTVVTTMRREYQNTSDHEVLLRALGRLWQLGCEPDWTRLRGGRPTAAAATLPPTALDERPLDIRAGTQLVHLPPAGQAAAPAAVLAVPVGSVAVGSVAVGSVAEAPASAPVPAPTPSAAPGEGSSEVETVLAALWGEVLGIEEIRSDDDFFDLGGDSLMSVQLIFGIEENLGFHVPAVTVFQESRLGPMAARIAAWAHSEGSAP